MWVRFDQLANNGSNYFHVNNIEASGLLSDNSTSATDTLGMYYYQGINTQVGYTTANQNGSSGLDDAYSPNGGSMPYTTPSVNTWICYEWMFGNRISLEVWFRRYRGHQRRPAGLENGRAIRLARSRRVQHPGDRLGAVVELHRPHDHVGR